MKAVINSLFVLSLISFCSYSGYAQISIGGNPPSFQQLNLNDSIPEIVMPHINNDSLLDADSSQQNGQNGPFRYGVPIDVNFGIDNSGAWDTLSNGGRLWRLKISSPDAYSINLIYDDFYMPEGALFYVYNQERTQILGAYTFINNNPGGKFATSLVQGDTVILELYETPHIVGQCLLNISRVIHAYKQTGEEQGSPGASGSCNIGVNCPLGEPWCIEKRSVVIINNANGAYCSGALVNNVNNDLTPYVLTANHCIQGQDVSTWIFYFQYYDSDCDNIVEAPSVFGMVGGTLRANNAFSDFALIQLYAPPPPGIGAHYAGWDNTGNVPNSGVGIHHPSGDLMKISSYGNQTVNAFVNPQNIHSWLLHFDNGVVEHGSSGSPLFNQNHSIVGQLYGTTSTNFLTCDNPNGDAVYGRFDQSWNAGGTAATQLRNWLDPNLTGAQQIGPTTTRVYLINRIITGTQNLTSLSRLSLEGNVSVTPIGSFIPFCQSNQIPLTTQPGSSVVFKSQDRVIIRKGVRLLAGSTVRVRTGPIDCANDNLINGDWINIFCNTDATLKKAPFTFDDAIWANNDGYMYSNEENGRPNEGNIDSKKDLHHNFQIYPNPSTGKFIIKVDKLVKDSGLIIQDVLGRNIIQNTISSSFTFVDLSFHPSGIYFLKVITADQVFVGKIVLQ